MTIPEKLIALRQAMAEAQIHVYIITSADPHQNEYVAARYRTREWISGFAGSAGTLAVTAAFAGLWVDSRYWLEAETAIKDSGIQLFCEGRHDVPSLQEWIATSQPAGTCVSYDATCLSLAKHQELTAALTRHHIRVEPGADLVDALWTDRPALDLKPVQDYDHPWLGATRQEKLDQVATWLQEQGLQWYLVSNTDEVCWLLNLRGSDVEFNPVFQSWLLVGLHGHVLFAGKGALPDELVHRLDEIGIALAQYQSLDAFLQTLPSEDLILLPPESTSMRSCAILGHLNQVQASSPVPTWKAAKSTSEQAALQGCLQRDGLAMVKFLHWIDRSIQDKIALDEYSIGLKVAEFRAAGQDYRGESFNPIVGWAANGAIIHYKAPQTGSAAIGEQGLLLIDSGGQYLDGTTDITRVVCVGAPEAAAVEAYTLVLQGHIRLATARFPVGTCGGQLDILARGPLWERGRNYGHSTGHGIGFFLNVHEGPQRIAGSATAMNAPLQAGNVLSNEPGYYVNGKFGIRIESMLLVREDTAHPGFLHFETLTVCPYERNLIDPAILTPTEREWLDRYHETVFKKLSKGLSKDEAHWLREKTKPL